jgi:dTDP-4-amino-4,6-dideoxygalactose transaminase
MRKLYYNLTVRPSDIGMSKLRFISIKSLSNGFLHMHDPNRFFPVHEPLLSGNDLSFVSGCVKSGWVSSLGKYILNFERLFAGFYGTRHGIVVSNGTTALHYPIHHMTPYHKDDSNPVAERLSRQGTNLPSAATLTEADIQRVVGVISQAGV